MLAVGTDGAGGAGAGAADGAGVVAAVVSVGVNDALRPLVPADVASSLAEAAFFAAASVLSPDVIACWPPCDPLSSPLLVASPEADRRTLNLPTVSAGSGTAELAPASVGSITTGSASVAAEARAAESPAAGVLPEDFPIDPFDFDLLDPLTPLFCCVASERGLPVLVRDGDMMPLSLTVSAAASSGSAIGTGGAMISGGWVDRPASSTPSSSVLTGAPMYVFVDTIREHRKLQTLLPAG